MKDFNKDKFNESISRKFAGAEVQPGNNVWEGIEAELLKQDNKRMQKKTAFYRNVAAAVIFVALISIYFNLQDLTFTSTEDSTFAPVNIDSQNDQKFVSDNDVLLKRPDIFTDSEDGSIGPERMGNENKGLAAFNNTEEENFKSEKIQNSEEIFYRYSDRELMASIAKAESIVPSDFALTKLDIQVEKVSYFAVSTLDKPKEGSNISWNTNVNIGSGNFNPNSEITETPFFSTASTLNNAGTAARTVGDNTSFNGNQERTAVEDLSSAPMKGNTSFTFGLNFGVVLNEKWNIKSGLQYGAFRSSSSSSTVLRDRNSDELYPFHGASSLPEISDGRVINFTSEYELYNDLQILTIPLMVSYKIIDRKFDVSVVAGLSADFIIRNNIKAGSDQINEINFDVKDRKSYNDLFASSIAGVEISYPFADKYAISLMPTYKRALSNVTTDAATFDSTPAFMGLNMSLAYMF
jgi:hypothetical protein